MLDLFLLGFLVILLAMGLKRPFIWVLAYIYVDIVAPQKVGWGLTQALPLSLIVFVAAFAGWLVLDSKKGSRFTPRQGLILALLGLCFLTTTWAEFQDSAWDKWNWVWKALVFAIFLPLTLRTKLRIEAAALFMVLAIATIVINGGVKTFLGGGGYGTLSLLVNDNVGLYESSIISIAAICTIPLALWLARFGTIFQPDWRVWTFTGALIFACLLIPVGTSARTGLICIAVLASSMLRSVRYKGLYVAGAGLALVAAIPFLPQSFVDRMGTISGYQSDESASTRIQVWEWTVDYAIDHPLGGGFDSYRGNSFTYTMPVVKEEGNVRAVTYESVTDQSRAFHSSYFEMLGEQGWLGLALWLWLQALGVWHMERVRWRMKKLDGDTKSWQWGLATALQQAQIVYLFGALFVGIAYQPYLFMLVGLQCALWSYVKRTTYQPRKANFRRPDPPAPLAPST